MNRMNDRHALPIDGSGHEKPDFAVLKRLGLARMDILCYEALFAGGPQTAGDLAKSLKKPRTSVYHALDRLKQSGFVKSEKIEIFHRVTRFRAVRLDRALEDLAITQRRAVQKLVDYQIEMSVRRQTGIE